MSAAVPPIPHDLLTRVVNSMSPSSKAGQNFRTTSTNREKQEGHNF